MTQANDTKLTTVTIIREYTTDAGRVIASVSYDEETLSQVANISAQDWDGQNIPLQAANMTVLDLRQITEDIEADYSLFMKQLGVE